MMIVHTEQHHLISHSLHVLSACRSREFSTIPFRVNSYSAFVAINERSCCVYHRESLLACFTLWTERGG